MYRHGDVLLGSIVPLPEGAVQRQSDVVAEGEATGHAHRLTGGAVWEHEGGLFLTAESEAAMTHEEHATLPIAATARGEAYPITIQREYDDEQEWRQVAD